MSHPDPDLLLRFLRGEASLGERRRVVRHLLAGCRQCATAILPVWGAETDDRWHGDSEGVVR